MHTGTLGKTGRGGVNRSRFRDATSLIIQGLPTLGDDTTDARGERDRHLRRRYQRPRMRSRPTQAIESIALRWMPISRSVALSSERSSVAGCELLADIGEG